VPRAFVPDGALAEDPVGRTVLAPLYPGEAVLGRRLAPDGLVGVAALLPEGAVALAVPVGPAALHLRVGDVVDVLATAGDGSTRVVAGDALVVDVREQTVTVAVGEREGPAVATALTQATVNLALTAG
jgi:Flp pilus assembly protein CpaB